MPQPKKHAVFSFFSGAGFLDLGFEKSGFEIVFANEINKDFVEGYQHSREKMGLPLPRFGIACDSIDDHREPNAAKSLKQQIAQTRKEGQSVGFIGGPPCPDFSVGGKNKGHTGDHGRLSRSYIDLIIIQKLMPKLHGSRSKLEGLLRSLLHFCAASGEARSDLPKLMAASLEKADDRSKSLEQLSTETEEHYPRSCKKLRRMCRKLGQDQFVSFAEA